MKINSAVCISTIWHLKLGLELDAIQCVFIIIFFFFFFFSYYSCFAVLFFQFFASSRPFHSIILSAIFNAFVCMYILCFALSSSVVSFILRFVRHTKIKPCNSVKLIRMKIPKCALVNMSDMHVLKGRSTLLTGP